MILEIRTYRLRPGSEEEFSRLVRDESLPLLADLGIRVVAFGLSLTAEDGRRDAYLIRAFESLEERKKQEAAFYGGHAWRDGPRDMILSLIDEYHTVVLDTPNEIGENFWRKDLSNLLRIW